MKFVPGNIVCSDCGVTHNVNENRDYFPVSYMIELDENIRTSYVVPPDLFEYILSQPFHSLKFIKKGLYELTVPLQSNGIVQEKLSNDYPRISNWYTKSNRSICPGHLKFHPKDVDNEW